VAQVGRRAVGASREMAKRSGKRLSSRWRGATVIELKEAPDGAAIDSDRSAIDATTAFVGKEHGTHKELADGGAPIFGIGACKDLRRRNSGIRKADIRTREANFDVGQEAGELRRDGAAESLAGGRNSG
jgi:hypothetical protein